MNFTLAVPCKMQVVVEQRVASDSGAAAVNMEREKGQVAMANVTV
jgi:hypothetical protein